MSKRNPLEIEGRGSETQVRVGENIDKITLREKG